MQSVTNAQATETEARARESAATAEPPGISQENAHTRARANAKSKDFEENASTAEKSVIRPASAPRTKEMQKEPGARVNTKEPGARDDVDTKGKATDFGRLTEKMTNEISIGTNKRRINHARRRAS